MTSFKLLGSSCVDQNEAVFLDFFRGWQRLQDERVFNDVLNSCNFGFVVGDVVEEVLGRGRDVLSQVGNESFFCHILESVVVC